MSAVDGSVSTFERAFCIAGDHPALPGHFPGSPLVPGVILLEQVAVALRAWRGERLARIVEAKFVVALLPDEPAVVRLAVATAARAASPEPASAADAPARLRFEIMRGDTLLARGIVEGAA